LKLKFQTVAEKMAKNFRGLLYFAAPGSNNRKEKKNKKCLKFSIRCGVIDWSDRPNNKV